MIREALQYLVSLANESKSPTKLDTGNPRAIDYLVGQVPVQVAKPKPPRDHGVDSLEDLIALANRFDEIGTFSPVVWVGAAAVVLVIDDHEHRCELATFQLEESESFRALRGLGAGSWHEQKAFIRLLRVTFGRAIAPGLLLDRVRKVRFENSQIVTTEKTRDRESMGRDITSRVAANDEIPETVVLEIPVFKLRPVVSIQCAIDVDPSRGLFQLVPMPDEIDRALAYDLNEIASLVKIGMDEEAHVYLGTP